MAAWRAAADELGLEIVSRRAGYGEPTLRGEFGPGTIRITRRCDTSACRVRFRARYDVGAPRLRAVAAGTRRRFRSPIVFDDDRFDGIVDVTGPDPAAIQAFLTPDRRAALSRLLFRFPTTVVRHHRLDLESHDISTTPARLLERGRAILTLVERLGPGG